MGNPKKDQKKSAEEPSASAASASPSTSLNAPTAAEGVQCIVVNNESDVGAASGSVAPKKRRLCRYPGCTKVIKSQGHCQRHGARAKRCKIEGCEKQAQGTHDGMCKRHWKAIHFPSPPPKPEVLPPPPEGDSVYDSILPASISFRPPANKSKLEEMAGYTSNEQEVNSKVSGDPLDPPAPPEGVPVMPLVTFLQEGRSKEAGWHRNAERRARGMFPHASLSAQLEPWERQLALVEILLLSGGTAYANFKDLAHAWGREKGFHHLLATSVCERRGEVERKKRSDAGRTMTDEEKVAFRNKLKKARVTTTTDEGEQQPSQQENQDDEQEQVAAAAAVMMEEDGDTDAVVAAAARAAAGVSDVAAV